MAKEEKIEKISLDPQKNEPKEVHKIDVDNKPIITPEENNKKIPVSFDISCFGCDNFHSL